MKNGAAGAIALVIFSPTTVEAQVTERPIARQPRATAPAKEGVRSDPHPEPTLPVIAIDRAAENVVTQAEDAFGTSIGHQVSVISKTLVPTNDDFGLAVVPGGRDCFRQAVATFSTVDLSIEAIEMIGWGALQASEDELLRLHGLGRRELPALLDRLRRPSESDVTAEKLVSDSKDAIGRAISVVPRLFVRTKVAPVVVRPIPKQMEASFPAAAYHQSHADNEPAACAINLSRPQERRLTAEAITFHETIPGHHASEGLGYPFGGPSTGILEGWGMYAEQLAGEMSLYSGKGDEAGMLVRRINAATRPIVETGVHVKGWPRSSAVEFMRARTAPSDADIELEVDGLLAGPGQPSYYIIGYTRFIAPRDHARTVLRKRFDLREFHGEVLRKGAVLCRNWKPTSKGGLRRP